MDEQLKSNLTSPKHWVRLVYMVLFAFCLYVAAMVMIGVVVVQFLFSLLSGSDNHKLRAFGYTLTMYIQQVLMFMNFNSEFKPFPFADWPDEPVITEPVVPESQAPISAEKAPAPQTPSYAKAQAPVEAKSQTQLDVEEPNKATPAEVEPAPPREAALESDKPSKTESDLENRDPPLVDPEAEKKILS